MTSDRNFFGELLMQALREFGEKQGRDVVYAAPLANRLRELLRVRLGNDNAEFDGRFFGPALYPELSSVDQAGLKFRDFLEAFPEMVEVFPTPSGDRVRVLDPEHSKRIEDLGQRYKSMLMDALRELAEFRNEPLVPTVQLVKWLKKRDPEFDPRRLNYGSMTDWLSSLGDIVEVSHLEHGGRVRLIGSAALASEPPKPMPSTRAGYLLVDSVDALSALHEVLGSKPSQAQLPDWGKVLRFVQQRFPAQLWKGRYFMALQRSQHDQLEGFRSYLEAVGYVVIPLEVQGDSLDIHRTVEERAAATNSALKRMLAAMKGQDAHVLLVSHSGAISEDLLQLVKERPPGAQVGLLCITDMLPDGLRRLRDVGAIILDLEKDARAFKEALPRRRLISPEAFDPSRYL